MLLGRSRRTYTIDSNEEIINHCYGCYLGGGVPKGANGVIFCFETFSKLATDAEEDSEGVEANESDSASGLFTSATSFRVAVATLAAIGLVAVVP